MTSVQRWRNERTRLCRNLTWRLFYSSAMACCNWWTLFTYCALILLLRWSHTCSLGFKSGDNAGHGNVWKLMSVDSVLNLAINSSVSTDGERLTDPCVAEIDRWGWTKKQIMFLDFVQGRGRGISARHNISLVLHPIVLQFIAAHQDTVLQQDNVHTHAAKLTRNFLATRKSRHYHGLHFHPSLTRLKFV